MAGAKFRPRHIAQLCSICRELELLGTDRYLSFEHEDEWPELNGLGQSASVGGCDFCKMLRESIISAPDDQATPSKNRDSTRRRRVVIDITSIHCQQQHEVTPRMLQRMRLNVRVRDQEGFPPLILRSCDLLICSDVSTPPCRIAEVYNTQSAMSSVDNVRSNSLPTADRSSLIGAEYQIYSRMHRRLCAQRRPCRPRSTYAK